MTTIITGHHDRYLRPAAGDSLWRGDGCRGWAHLGDRAEWTRSRLGILMLSGSTGADARCCRASSTVTLTCSPRPTGASWRTSGSRRRCKFPTTGRGSAGSWTSATSSWPARCCGGDQERYGTTLLEISDNIPQYAGSLADTGLRLFLSENFNDINDEQFSSRALRIL